MSKFKEIGVSKDLCQGINEMGFIKPTEVQEKSIPFLLFENSKVKETFLFKKHKKIKTN